MWQFSIDLMVIIFVKLADYLELHVIGPPFVLLHAPPLDPYEYCQLGSKRVVRLKPLLSSGSRGPLQRTPNPRKKRRRLPSPGLLPPSAPAVADAPGRLRRWVMRARPDMLLSRRGEASSGQRWGSDCADACNCKVLTRRWRCAVAA